MAMEKLEWQLQKNISAMIIEVAEARHEYITVEHLLWALLDNSSARGLLQGLQVELSLIREQLQAYFDQYLVRHKIELEDDSSSDMKVFRAHMTPAFKRVMERAIQHVERHNSNNESKKRVNGGLLLLYILGESESVAAHILQQQGVNQLKLRRALSNQPDDDDNHRQAQQKSSSSDAEASKDQQQADESYLVSLNERAQAGSIDPLIGRSSELKLLMETLLRRRKNNPLLVGEAGVGKTAIVEGLALALQRNEVPPALAGMEIYQLQLGSMLAGSRYRGDFEERLTKVLNQLQQRQHAVLFIDELHTIIGAGGASNSALDAANMLKPVLASGQLRCLGATTFAEYRRFIESDPTLLRRFRKIEVKEPSIKDCYQIIEGLAGNFERHHNIKLSPEVIKSSVDLADRYLSHSHMPDKAIDLIDALGARRNLRSKSNAKKRSKAVIHAGEVAALVAEMAQVPVDQLQRKAPEALANLRKLLGKKIFGQDRALDTLVQAVQLAYAGLRPQEKTQGAFLFAGPTGVGKTEVCRQLAGSMSIKLLRFDMSEYAEKHSVSRLIGAPPGYVGFETGGLLTEAVHKNPHSLVLLDEIEKAHPDIYQLLLQIMDYGKLTDSNGRECNFQHCLLVMTTNLGAQELQKSQPGFQRQQQRELDASDAINRHFAPEFRNRLDDVVQFSALSPEVMRAIVDLRVQELRDQLQDKSIDLRLSARARGWLAEQGYHPTLGARPLNRLLEKQVRAPLAQQLLFGQLRSGGRVSIGVRANKLRFDIKGETEALVEVSAHG